MAERTLIAAVNEALDIALTDPRVVLMGEDVGATGGVFRASEGLLARHGGDRVIDTPVAESGIIGAAYGLAVAGMRPIAELQFMGFSYPAYDQIISHVGRIRNRSQHRFTAPMVIRITYGAGIGAAEHHSESSEAIYVHIPGIKVVVPSTAHDAKGLLLAAVDDPDPVIFLEPIRLYRAVKDDVPEGRYTIELGSARVARIGSEVTLLAYGSMMKDALEAAAILETDGVSAEVIDVRSLVPLDIETLVDSVEKTGRCVVIQEAQRTGGFAAELVAQLQEQAIFSLEAPIERVTGWDTVVPLRRAEHHFFPTPERIIAAVRRTLEI